jgi:hypothetical protein
MVHLQKWLRLAKKQEGSVGLAVIVTPAVALLAGGSATAARTAVHHGKSQ